MACIRRRRGKWVVDYRDGACVRRWATCETKREAEDVLSAKLRESRQATASVVRSGITVREYAEQWLRAIAVSVKPRTVESYGQMLANHVLPAFGGRKVARLHKAHMRDFLIQKLAGGLSRNTVRVIHATLRTMLTRAVEDGIILVNPAVGLGRALRLASRPAERQRDLRALTRSQVATLLGEAPKEPQYHALFLLLARTGLRIGEARALRWDDFDFDGRLIRVERSLSAKGLIQVPKSGETRRVDMSQGLRGALIQLRLDRKKQTLRAGWKEMPSWVFCTSAGAPLDESRTRKVFQRTLKCISQDLI